jgi:phytanoyl-CoA hydroxylase
MIQLQTPHGLPVQVPETDAEDPSLKFTVEQRREAKDYYHKYGYVVFRDVIERQDCERAMSLWADEVKPSSEFIYRQATARAEKNVLDEHGRVMNPILNLQSIGPKHFPKLRNHSVERILTAKPLTDILREVLADETKIVQSMYFEGNSATWEHQDSYYLDSENVGAMTACWIALENISAKAGRFSVCPGSHRIDLGRQNAQTNIADHHDVYIGQVVQEIRRRALMIRAPKLNQGNVLLWNAWTIHGSIASNDELHSRSSITCHVIPNSDRFLQLHSRSWMPPVNHINEAWVWRPKDQAVFKNRVILWLESKFPSAFYALKRAAIRVVVAK